MQKSNFLDKSAKKSKRIVTGHFMQRNHEI